MASMEHLIGQRFSLISKSQIRYEGILHEINPEQSTIALEEVYSFGTEERKVDNFIPATQQKYDYIVFRGSDVKDISIVEGDKPQEPEPSNIPNDPAILNSSRPGPPSGPSQGPPQNRGQSPFPPPGYPPQTQQFGPGPGPGPGPGYYPPHQQYGRGFGPPPGAFGHGPGFHPYGPPPPGYFGPPGHGFPQGPGQFPQAPPPIGPPGQRHNAPNQLLQQSPPHQAPAPSQGPQPTSELPVDIKAASKQPSKSSTPVPAAPAPVEAKQVETQPPTAPLTMAAIAARPPPTQPKGGKVAPAMPFTVNQKSFTPPVQAATDATNSAKQVAKPSQSRAEIDDAQAKAREAVAAALAKVAPPSSSASAPVPTAAAIDHLSKKMSEMGQSTTITNGAQRGRGGFGRGRGGYPRVPSGGQQGRKIEIPKSDYDFESANAKFNKEDLIKEAIASGSPTVEAAEETTNGATEEHEVPTRKDSIPVNAGGKAYNKATSFFDNISSEAKERDDVDARANARQHRGEEFKRNVETFGQGNVDGGFRGRGRGGYGRGRQYGGNYRGSNRGFNRGYGNRGRGGPQVAPPTETAS